MRPSNKSDEAICFRSDELPMLVEALNTAEVYVVGAKDRYSTLADTISGHHKPKLEFSGLDAQLILGAMILVRDMSKGSELTEKVVESLGQYERATDLKI